MRQAKVAAQASLASLMKGAETTESWQRSSNRSADPKRQRQKRHLHSCSHSPAGSRSALSQPGEDRQFDSDSFLSSSSSSSSANDSAQCKQQMQSRRPYWVYICSEKGCKFEGSREELDEHTCPCLNTACGPGLHATHALAQLKISFFLAHTCHYFFSLFLSIFISRVLSCFI